MRSSFTLDLAGYATVRLKLRETAYNINFTFKQRDSDHLTPNSTADESRLHLKQNPDDFITALKICLQQRKDSVSSGSVEGLHQTYSTAFIQTPAEGKSFGETAFYLSIYLSVQV